MRYFLFLVTIILCFVNKAQAEQLNFQWTPNSDSTQGYYLYETNGSDRELLLTLDNQNTSTAQLEQVDDGNCHTYFLTAYNENLESEPSDTATWCPDSEIPGVVVRPGKPATFMITITPVQ